MKPIRVSITKRRSEMLVVYYEGLENYFRHQGDFDGATYCQELATAATNLCQPRYRGMLGEFPDGVDVP